MRISAVKVGIYSLCAAQLFFGTAHGAENPANGLLMKTFEFGDSGVCAANFIERELDWSGAERVAGFGRVNSSDGWKKGMMVAYKGWLWNRTDKDVKWAFFENFDNAAMVKVDGKKVLDDGEYRSTTSAAVTLAPGAHFFEARFANYSDHGGPSKESWQGWHGCPALGFAVNKSGDTNAWLGGGAYDGLGDAGDFTSVNPGAKEPKVAPGPKIATYPRRKRPSIAKGTMLADNGRLLRGCCITTTNDGNPPTREGLASVRGVGLNVVHYYAECPHPNYPAEGARPGYSVAEVDRAVKLTRELGLYLVLNLYEPPGTFKYEWTMDFWKFYAARYKDETHVIYEIHNEPVTWSPPYVGENANPKGAVKMNVDAYRYIRSVAPDTPLLVFSYSQFRDDMGPEAMKDIKAFEEGVGGDAKSIWRNTCISFHGYGGARGTEKAAKYLMEKGYPLFMTEYYSFPWGGDSNGQNDSELTGFCEENGISWMTFLFTPPAPWGHDVTNPDRFSGLLDKAGIAWKPDFGEWPKPRRLVTDGGKAYRLGAFENGKVAGRLAMNATDAKTDEFAIDVIEPGYYSVTLEGVGGKDGKPVRREAFFDAGRRVLRLPKKGRNVKSVVIEPVAQGPLPDGEYAFVNKATGLQLVFKDGTLVQGSKTDAPEGRLVLKHLGGGQYLVTNKVNGQVLIRQWSGGDGVGFATWGWEYPETHQRWIFRREKGEGVCRFACIDDGHDFTVAEGGAGAKMLQCNKKYAGEDIRQWIVTKL
jgi:hypothetical protein